MSKKDKNNENYTDKEIYDLCKAFYFIIFLNYKSQVTLNNYIFMIFLWKQNIMVKDI